MPTVTYTEYWFDDLFGIQSRVVNKKLTVDEKVQELWTRFCKERGYGKPKVAPVVKKGKPYYRMNERW